LQYQEAKADTEADEEDEDQLPEASVVDPAEAE